MTDKKMEVLKKERSLLRASFTKAMKKTEELVKESEVDGRIEHLESQLELMRMRMEAIAEKDADILIHMYEAEAEQNLLDEEQEKVDFYQLNYFRCKKLVEKEVMIDHQSIQSVSASAVSTPEHKVRKFKLPQLKMKEFDGDLKNWLPFWSQFEKIDKDPDLEEVDKLSYLIMSMTVGSQAREFVDSYPATGNMYKRVVEALKARFGREDLLTEYYIRELLRLILQNTASTDKLPVAVLYDRLQCHLRNLETLGVSSKNCAPILMPLVSSCLTQEMLQVWERNIPQINATQPNAGSKEYLDSLMLFLKAEVDGAQKLELAKSGFGITNDNSAKNTRTKERKLASSETITTAAGLLNTKGKDSNACVFCSATHKSVDCRKALNMSLTERRQQVNAKRACYCCLRTGHLASFCKYRPKCTRCNRAHFVIMCDKDTKSNTPLISTNLPSSSLVSHGTITKPCAVLMQTLVVNIEDNNGDVVKKARVLIDTGSQRSYILASTAADIGYSTESKEMIQHALFGGTVSNSHNHSVFRIYLANLDNTFRCNLEALDQPKICGQINTIPNGPWINELAAKDISLSDYGCSADSEIEILLGSDVAGKLYTGKIVELSSGLVAIETKLGWTISGKVPGKCKESNNTIATVVTNLLIKEATIADLWTLDTLGITDTTDKMNQLEIDRVTETHFLNTVKVNEDQRFEVCLPWMENHPPFGDNYTLSCKRLQSTVKKLNKDNYYDEYQKVFDKWEQAGIIEEVPQEEVNNSKIKHYLPHFPVIKTNSTTPVRPVYDASVKEQGTYSLNECLSKGPNLIEKIPASIARFRKGKIGVSGDIEKAFLQISICKEDRDFLRFVWMDKHGELKTYRHCRVVFGVTTSPFLLESCIKLHLENILKMCKEGKADWPIPLVELLAKSFYVDNCITSLNDIKQAEEFMHNASSIMRLRKFELRGWEKSSEEDGRTPNVLGLVWDKKEDSLSISIESFKSMKFETVTKKVILSAAHRIFDPIGIVSSVVLIPKLLLQETWDQGLAWNEEVNEDIKKRFLCWMAEVPLITQVKIPRWIFEADSDSTVDDNNATLHVFCDASKTAYAATIFIRVQHKDKVTVQLLASRARVAPSGKSRKGITIPRLELLAASIAARLYKSVVKDFGFSNMETTFWTDATTVLAWLQRNEPWDVFVRNRVKEINMLTGGCKWQHIPGQFNPADLPSRGCSIKKLLQCRWWEGPLWLRDTPEQWPESVLSFNEEDILMERKKTIVSSMLTQGKAPIDQDWYKYFSQYNKIVRMIGWIIRFTNNCRLKSSERLHQDLSAEEFQLAEQKVFMLVQNESLSDTDKLKHLLPFKEDGLLRLKTKVSNRTDHKDFCHPVILPGEHPVVQRLIMSIHKENSHAGGQILLSITRQKFWIIGGRRIIRSVITTCVTCKRYDAKKMNVEPTPLPESRVRDAKVFEVTGVDIAGPLFIKGDDRKVKKVWICLFTCAVYRAVRLELVSSMSTDCFIQAFRRFCSRQGRPSIVYSDNGSNFVGFDGVCVKMNWNKIAEYSTARRIEWRFNPPAAPWWGGWWERLIGVMKGLLRRVLKKTSLNYEELLTVICDVESVINQRPLTYVSDDSQDLTPITPNMFLLDIQEVGMPEYDFYGSVDLQNRVKYRQELTKTLRERFRVEYLGQLQLFARKKPLHTITLGEIVLIGDDNSKRINWPLGRVVELLKGNDGNIRVVRIQTENGILTRPLQRIYPLEWKSSVPADCESVPADIRSPLDIIQPSPMDVMPTPKSSEKDDSILVPSAPICITRHGRCIKKPQRFDI